MKNDGLYYSLESYSNTKAYPFHMPGHKRNTGLLGKAMPFNIDITEINGFDDLHNADGILKKVSEKAQALYNSDRSFILVNGSTCGILAAITSVVHRGSTVIAARNCHKSVYNACALSELDVRFVYPPVTKSGVCGSISPESIRCALEECSDPKAVIITSPTYEGVISDVETIARICHERNAVLIVDNAHGAHLPFCTFGKKGDPISSGADIVVSSLHKTLPALTQTSVAHVMGDRADPERFAKYLSVFETSSPSYVLMASIDACLDFTKSCKKQFAYYENELSEFSKKMSKLEKLKILCAGNDTIEKNGFYSFDRGKIVIETDGTTLSGVELSEILRDEYSLELEMAYPNYALAMTSVCDTADGMKRLADALLEIDKKVTRSKGKQAFPSLPKPMRIRMTNAEIDMLPDLELTREQAASGRYISHKYIYAYPPGVPIAAPGEIIGMFEYEYIEMLKKSGVNIVVK